VAATWDLLRQLGKNFARNQRKQGAVTLCVEATPHGEIAMNKIIISAIALAATASIAFAADDSSLTTKAMKDQPGTMGGSTDMPTAKPDSGSLSEKAMKDQPGTK
jgi:inosine/xanthosine triphosphate pyrophosphatase family protein